MNHPEPSYSRPHGLSGEQWIDINALGPFAHSRYVVDGTVVSHESPLDGRADQLVATVDAAIAAFCPQDRFDLRILDVGCNDGYVLTRLGELGYRNLHGIEPREQTIERGKALRALLGIPEFASYTVGDLEHSDARNDAKADVVLCLGVLHHVREFATACSRLKSLTSQFLVVESLTLSDELVTPQLFDAIAPKDVVYRQRDREASVFGIKWESDYFPGSATQSGLVAVPTRQALIWELSAAGFDVGEPLSGWEEGREGTQIASTQRPDYASTILTAVPSTAPDWIDSRDQILGYESAHCLQLLPEAVVAQLEDEVGESDVPITGADLDFVVALADAANTDSAAEVIRSIAHSPRSKLALERAKLSLAGGDIDTGYRQLTSIVSSFCPDWRTVYRAFFLLAQWGPTDERENWLELLRTCQPRFPMELLGREFHDSLTTASLS